MTARLENWALSHSEDEVEAAQVLCNSRLTGEVYNHPVERHYDGKEIITSPIRKSIGRQVTTRTGTVYELGEVHPEYAKYLESIGHDIDPDQPIKILSDNSE